jgi:hypothetical protein
VDERIDLRYDPELRIRMRVAAQYDAPAYVRRARRVEDAYEELLDRCRGRRVELLEGVRLHLGALRAGTGSWDAVRPLLADAEQVTVLDHLYAEAGDPAYPMTGPTDPRRLRRALRALAQSVERFNRRWLAFVGELDLTEINALRDGYNRYYLLEKECALGSSRLHARTFQRLEPVTTRELLARLPPLPVPRAAG